MENERKTNRTWLYVVLIIIAALVSCGIGGLVGGAAGYVIGRRSVDVVYHQMPFHQDEAPESLVPQPRVPRMPGLPRIPDMPRVLPDTPEIPDDLLPRFLEGGGAWVLTVTPDSPAEDAGLQPGDIITKADRQSLAERDLAEIISEYHVGDRVRLTVRRGNEELVLSVRLGQHPDKPGEQPWLGITYRTIPRGLQFRFDWPEGGRFDFDWGAERM